MKPRLFWLLMLGGLGGAVRADDLGDAKKQWGTLDRDGKIVLLMRLSALAPEAPSLPDLCVAWLKDGDCIVRGHVARLLAACGPKGEAPLVAYVTAHLKERARREQREFDEVCRAHGRKLPPPGEMKAGAKWKDPWDESVRTPPVEVREERAHMSEVVGALESAGGDAALERIFAEHHDPEVLLRVIACWRKRRTWTALPAMADLARIQQFGRAMGGGAVIGEELFTTLQLKWDVHKDRLWWSRPEYVPRASRPIAEAAGEITGGLIRNARELDGWLLANEARLAAHGVKLTPEFRARAAETQRG